MPADRTDRTSEVEAAGAAVDGAAMSRLFARAADDAEEAGDYDAAAFYLTHAYVYSLDAGLASASAYHAKLKEKGREE